MLTKSYSRRSLTWCMLSLLLMLRTQVAVADFLDLDDAPPSGSAQTVSSTDDFDIDLYALNEKELEQICTDRGFELVTDVVDDATGEVIEFSHDDYVEAARQCLSIERDLEQVIAEHPEILEELEAEKEKMMKEKEQLEKKLEEASQTQEGTSAAASAFGVPKVSSEEPKAAAEDTPVEDSPTEAATETENNDTITKESKSTTTEPEPATEGIVAAKEESTNAVAAMLESKLRALQSLLGPHVKAVLQKLDHLILDKLPPSMGSIVRKVLVRLYDDAVKTLRFSVRMIKATIGMVMQQIEKRKEAAAADEAEK